MFAGALWPRQSSTEWARRGSTALSRGAVQVAHDELATQEPTY
jgi:hypothetical protein